MVIVFLDLADFLRVLDVFILNQPKQNSFLFGSKNQSVPENRYNGFSKNKKKFFI